jgi:hypothetical protein
MIQKKEMDNSSFCDLKDKIMRKLADVEKTMKYELGVNIYKNPITIMRKLELTRTSTETLNKVYAKNGI